MDHLDVIVLGLGGVGSATARALALRGARVLGIEQFDLVHDRGSSHGETRIIRKAYFEHPDYVPLLSAAYRGWDGLAAEAGRTLFERTGLLLVGPREGAVVGGTLEAARQHDLPLEVFDAGDLSRRHPGFQDAPGLLGLFEADAGFLRVEDCVRAALDGAVARGARLLARSPALSWRAVGNGVEVETAGERHRADRLVICGGAWAPRLLAGLGVALEPQRKVQLWLGAGEGAPRLDRGSPTFGFHIGGRFFYGFPSLDGQTVKVAEHGPGAPVPNPAALDRALHPDDLPRVVDFAAAHLREVGPRVSRHAACMYTLSPDEHFVVDRHPEHPQVALCAGLSGHGFKFATALGEALADLALEGATALPVGFLGLHRFQRAAHTPMPIVE